MQMDAEMNAEMNADVMLRLFNTVLRYCDYCEFVMLID